MLEIGILVFLLLAFGYWVTLWIMGRRDDVLHGQFVEFEQGETSCRNDRDWPRLRPFRRARSRHDRHPSRR